MRHYNYKVILQTIIILLIILFLIKTQLIFIFLTKTLPQVSSAYNLKNILFSNVFYTPGENTFLIGSLGGVNAHIIIYFLVIYSFCVLRLFNTISKIQSSSRLKLLKTVIFSFVAVTIFLQSFNQLFVFKRSFDLHINIQNKINSSYGGLLEYSHVHFKKYCRAKFLTDIDISNSPDGMYSHRLLAYQLYPVDIRNIHPNEPVDIIIVFKKKNPDLAIPTDFEIIKKFSVNSLIALRKGSATYALFHNL